VAPTTPVPTKDLEDLIIQDRPEHPRGNPPENREASVEASDRSSGNNLIPFFYISIIFLSLLIHHGSLS